MLFKRLGSRGSIKYYGTFTSADNAALSPVVVGADGPMAAATACRTQQLSRYYLYSGARLPCLVAGGIWLHARGVRLPAKVFENSAPGIMSFRKLQGVGRGDCGGGERISPSPCTLHHGVQQLSASRLCSYISAGVSLGQLGSSSVLITRSIICQISRVRCFSVAAVAAG